MKVLWEVGPSTPAELVGHLAEEGIELAESTVRTMLGILREKGYLRTERRGRAFTYHPVVNREEATLSAVRHMISRFFDGSPGDLVLNLLAVSYTHLTLPTTERV